MKTIQTHIFYTRYIMQPENNPIMIPLPLLNEIFQDNNPLRVITPPTLNRTTNWENILQTDEEVAIMDSLNDVSPFIKVLSEEGKQLLKTVAYLPEQLRENGVEYNEEDCDGVCPITQDEFEEGELVTLLPCGHIFSEDAIEKWFSMSHKCPLCRHELPHKEVRTENQNNTRNPTEHNHILNLPNEFGEIIEDPFVYNEDDAYGENDAYYGNVPGWGGGHPNPIDDIVRASPISIVNTDDDSEHDDEEPEEDTTQEQHDEIQQNTENTINVIPEQQVQIFNYSNFVNHEVNMDPFGILQMGVDRIIAREDELQMQLALMESMYIQQQQQDNLNTEHDLDETVSFHNDTNSVDSEGEY